jgi:hypothetical protein
MEIPPPLSQQLVPTPAPDPGRDPGIGGSTFWASNFAAVGAYVVASLATMSINDDVAVAVIWACIAVHALVLLVLAGISAARGNWRDAGALVLITVALPFLSCGSFCLGVGLVA